MEPTRTAERAEADPAGEGEEMAFFCPVGGNAGQEAMEHLACRMAHDFNDALTSITGLGSLMAKDLEGGLVRSENLRGILEAARRAGALTSDLLAYSRGVSRDLRPRLAGAEDPIDLRKFLDARRGQWQARLGDAVALEIVPAASPVAILAPEAVLEAILDRILANIRDVLREGGEARMGVSRRELGPAFCAERGIVPGVYAAIRIADNGPGMEPEIARRAFDPFFTTRRDSGARGLGLAVAHGLTRDMGGHIEFMTGPGKGCTVTVFLPGFVDSPATLPQVPAPPSGETGVAAPAAPAAEPAVPPPPSPSAPDAPAPGVSPGAMRKPSSTGHTRETILVVEDEPMVRELVTRSLGYHGYRVIKACDGQEGYDLATAHADEIDIIFSDIVMPRMSGPEMVQRLREAGLDFRVLFTTGFTESARVMENGELRDGVHILAKPYATRELAERIRESLDAA